MNAPAIHGAAGVRLSSPAGALTEVELVWREKQIEHWIRFGHAVQEQRLDRRRRILSFPAGAVIAFVRWASNGYGSVLSRIDILRAVRPGDGYQTLPSVRPGAEILLQTSGWPRVERVLLLIDAIEALDIDPAKAAPDYWRHVHNRLAAGDAPRAYSHQQHRAWRLRKRAEP
jgi:hypothetical protein